jgi:hypothetical protein
MIYTLSMATISFRNFEKMTKLKCHIVVFSLKMLTLRVKVIFLPQKPE